MPISIDPPRRVPPARRARKADERPKASTVVDSDNLPIPVGQAKTIPGGGSRVGGDAAIHAQVLGEKRGLRAGPGIHGQAKSSYNQTHWSGANDRRRPKGGGVKTDV